jgi:hypothetical protein
MTCPDQGQLVAQPLTGGADGVVGRLAARANRLDLVVKGGPSVATAEASAEMRAVRSCVQDGVAYTGILSRFGDEWVIAYHAT